MSTSDPLERWEEKAAHDKGVWGSQSPEALTLAIIEETAEICEVILEESGAPEDNRAGELQVLLAYIRDLGIRVEEFLTEHFQDEFGQPVPQYKRPSLNLHLDEPHALRDELDDLASLCIQLDTAIEDATLITDGGVQAHDIVPDDVDADELRARIHGPAKREPGDEIKRCPHCGGTWPAKVGTGFTNREYGGTYQCVECRESLDEDEIVIEIVEEGST